MHPLHPLNPRALIGMIAVLGFLAVAGLLASQPGWANLAHAQDSPSVAIELSGDSVEPGTAITVTMSFGGLESDSDKATRDYIFRADVKDSDNEDADGCEDRKNGYGLGVERYMWMVDQDPEVRRGATSAGCPAGGLHGAGHDRIPGQRGTGVGQRELFRRRAGAAALQ